MKSCRNKPFFLTYFIKPSYWLTIVLCFQAFYLPVALSSTQISDQTDPSKSQKKPISIEADSAEQDEKLGITTYKGNVKIQQGGLSIKAHKVQLISSIEQADGSRQLEKIIASGKPAIFSHQPNQQADTLTAEGGNIDYLVKQGIVRLQDNATLQQQGSSVSGDFIEYFIAEQRVVAKADPKDKKTRVKTVIIPGSETFFSAPIEQ